MNGMPACDRGRPVAPSEHVLSVDSALGMGDEASAPWSCVQLGRDGQKEQTPHAGLHMLNPGADGVTWPKGSEEGPTGHPRVSPEPR